jgi:hypothetical protein
MLFLTQSFHQMGIMQDYIMKLFIFVVVMKFFFTWVTKETVSVQIDKIT